MAKSKEPDFDEVFFILDEIEEDSSVPKNIRLGTKEIRRFLDEKIDLAIKVDKALHKLEELTDDVNVDSFTRMRLYNLSSALETMVR